MGGTSSRRKQIETTTGRFDHAASATSSSVMEDALSHKAHSDRRQTSRGTQYSPRVYVASAIGKRIGPTGLSENN